MPRGKERPNDDVAADRVAFEEAVGRVASVDAATLREAFALTRPRRLSRGETLLRAGDRAADVYVVVDGILREYFPLDDGTERTKAFVRAREFSGSLADLLSGAPSRATIEAATDCRILGGSYASFAALSARNAAWERFSRRATELLLLRKAEREFELLGLDAATRYAGFAARFPGLEAEIAAKHVASYLGITPVHLSRLRRARRDRARETRRVRSPR